MAEYIIQEETLIDIADAIREKEGGGKPVPAVDYAPRVLALPGRDGSVTVKWDGNTIGKTVIEREVPGTQSYAVFCKVSDWVFTEEQIKAGRIDMYGQASDRLSDIWEDSPFIVIGDGYYNICGAVFAQRDNVVVSSGDGDIVYPEAGLWFSKIVNYSSNGDVMLVNSIFTTTLAVGGEQATPEIAVDENGLITATAGDKSATKQLSTQSGKTITPGPTEQIAVAAGKYVTGDVIVAAVQNTGGSDGIVMAVNVNGRIPVYDRSEATGSFSMVGVLSTMASGTLS